MLGKKSILWKFALGGRHILPSSFAEKYIVLGINELTQLLFIAPYFPSTYNCFLTLWNTKWFKLGGASGVMDKVLELGIGEPSSIFSSVRYIHLRDKKI